MQSLVNNFKCIQKVRFVRLFINMFFMQWGVDYFVYYWGNGEIEIDRKYEMLGSIQYKQIVYIVILLDVKIIKLNFF